MKRDFNRWLASLGPSAPVKTLTELRQWNLKHERSGALRYGQSNLDISDEMDVEADRARYEADRAKDLALTAAHGIDEVMQANKLDALLFPGSNGSALAARPGYPSIIVPFAMVPNTTPFPAGSDARPGPFGVTFSGLACSEPRLIEMGFAFEQATTRGVPPPLPLGSAVIDRRYWSLCRRSGSNVVAGRIGDVGGLDARCALDYSIQLLQHFGVMFSVVGFGLFLGIPKADSYSFLSVRDECDLITEAFQLAKHREDLLLNRLRKL
jgi:hypothetical protein